MLEKYFSAPKTLRRLRSGISGPYIDAFAGDLEREGYARTSAVRYLRAAAHLGCFVQRRGGVLADIDCSTLHAFVGHLRRCRCPHFKRAKVAFHARFGVKLFHQRLVGCGICPSESVRDENADPALVTAFLDWFQTHRGARQPTLRLYGRGAAELLQALGDAMLRYLGRRPTASDADHVFVRSIAPYRPFVSGDGVSSVVRHALQRASIEVPDKGAHLLRHTAATEMLRNGVPLEQAGLVLRHRSIDMTAYYAKADVALLKQIAQPWPEVNR